MYIFYYGMLSGITDILSHGMRFHIYRRTVIFNPINHFTKSTVLITFSCRLNENIQELFV